METVLYIAVLVVGAILWYAVGKKFDANRATPGTDTESKPGVQSGHSQREGSKGSSSEDPPHAESKSNVSQSQTDNADRNRAAMTTIYRLANELEDFVDNSAHPNDVVNEAKFEQAVSLFASDIQPVQEVAQYAMGGNTTISCMALEALCLRDDRQAVAAQIADNTRHYWAWPLFFALKFLSGSGEKPVVGRILTNTEEWWPQNAFVRERIEDLLGLVDEEERVDFRRRLPDFRQTTVDAARMLLKASATTGATQLLDELAGWQTAHVDTSQLGAIGRVWTATDVDTVIEHEALVSDSATIRQEILRGRRSIIVSGEPGVGKTALIQFVGQQLMDEGWIVFQASAAEIVAGQIYIGSLEARVKNLTDNLGSGKRAVWVVDNVHELAFAGRVTGSPTSLIDLLAPAVINHDLVIIGETTPTGLERLADLKPAFIAACEAIRIQKLGTDATLDLAQRWLEHGSPSTVNRLVTVEDSALADALQLVRQHLPDSAEPGNLINLLTTAVRFAPGTEVDESADLELDTQSFVEAVARTTGLPHAVLDDHHQLDLDELGGFFSGRVVGQDEAVDCLVDRIAMIKAGLTDPTRPYGVFLFVGPTGTGKTEIAKTLAEYLFGSPERMIRLDMSEFQTSESLDRLLGSASEDAERKALVNQIRQHPFSVLLLDEFEKAHPSVWDLFLQIFDDGRLTDRRGNTADFRHCIIIMTSNLGATVKTGPGLGFDAKRHTFSVTAVQKALATTFRSEFINRVDRVVVFRPLGRADMRKILQFELAKVLERRGLRSKGWAVEWEDSAIEFLLDRGYTAELGARPLKRAIEQYVLAPLSKTIVAHDYPDGDQFLFVRAAGDKISAQFVDPDAPGDNIGKPLDLESEELSGGDIASERSVRNIALHSDGSVEEFAVLRATFDKLVDRLESDEWIDRKERGLARMSESSFWQSADRFDTLGEVEFIDRLQTGLETAGSLIDRMAGGTSGRERYPRDLVERLAHQLYLVDAAVTTLEENAPRDAVISIEPGADLRGSDLRTADKSDSTSFAEELTQMYLSWAQKRRMRARVIGEPASVQQESQTMDSKGARTLIAVSGFGAHRVLEPEAGLHVLERDVGNSSVRTGVRVRVAGYNARADSNSDAAREECTQALQLVDDTPPAVVRRYRREPSPLVRDAVREWRTGRIDVVLGGDFDLMG